MGEGRRDAKGNKLRKGESQRKDGCYVYKYKGLNGKPQFVYSWKLKPTDKLPAGKRECKSLREKIDEIESSLKNGKDFNNCQKTVLSLVKQYTYTRNGVKPTTKASYNTVINILSKESFGARKIGTVELLDAKEFLCNLHRVNGLGYSSIHSVHGVLRPAFRDAVDSKLIPRNPFDFSLSTIITKSHATREAVSQEQQDNFLEFIKADKHFCKYYEGIYILFHSGLRISEFVGLTVDSLDMENKIINVERQLLRKSDGTKYIQSPKSKSGTRKIPMLNDVYTCFQKILANRNPPENEPSVDGYSGFLYFDKDGQPMVAMHWEKYFQHIIKKYNKHHDEKLPKITPHVCRHTFCSYWAKRGISPKALQNLMGHSDISITLDTYTHYKYDEICKEIIRIEALEAEDNNK